MNEALRILRDRGLASVKPGANGGIVVANPAAQIRLVGIDLWFRRFKLDPKNLFEARAFLEDLFEVAVARAAPEDIRAMYRALDETRAAAGDPHGFFDADMRFHLVIARACRIKLLIGFYESIITVLRGARARGARPGSARGDAAALARRAHGHRGCDARPGLASRWRSCSSCTAGTGKLPRSHGTARPPPLRP